MAHPCAAARGTQCKHLALPAQPAKDSPGLLWELIEDIKTSAQRDTPWHRLVNKEICQVDLPTLFYQWTQNLQLCWRLLAFEKFMRDVEKLQAEQEQKGS